MTAVDGSVPETPFALRLAGAELFRRDPRSGVLWQLRIDTLCLPAGGRIGLIGKSGSGKTTLLEMLGLLSVPHRLKRYDLRVSEGGQYVSLEGTILSRKMGQLAALRARCIGFVLQDGGLLPYLSVAENAELAGWLAGVGPADLTQRIREQAAFLGIEGLLARKPSELSGGQRQRAAILRAIAPGARLIIADEPTAALDPENSDQVLSVLTRGAARNGAALIIASHNEVLLRRHGFAISRIENRVDDSGTLAWLAPADVPQGRPDTPVAGGEA